MFDVRWNMPLRACFGLGTISWGLKLETRFLLEFYYMNFPAWSGDVMTSSSPNFKWWSLGSVERSLKILEKPPQPKKHIFRKEMTFFFFGGGFSGKSSGPPIPKSSMFSGTETSPRFRGEQVGRDESGGRWNEGVGSERAPVSCWLFMVGRLDELMAYKKPLVILK